MKIQGVFYEYAGAMCEYTGGNMGMYRVCVVYMCRGQCLNKLEVIM